MSLPAGCDCQRCKNKQYFCRHCGKRIVLHKHQWHHVDANSPEIPRDKACEQTYADPDDRSL